MKEVKIKGVVYTKKRIYTLTFGLIFFLASCGIFWYLKGYRIWFVLGGIPPMMLVVIGFTLMIALFFVALVKILRETITLQADEVSLWLILQKKRVEIPFSQLKKIVIVTDKRGIATIRISSKKGYFSLSDFVFYDANSSALEAFFFSISKALKQTLHFHSCILEGSKNILHAEYIYHPKIPLPSLPKKTKFVGIVITGLIIGFAGIMTTIYFLTQQDRGKSIHGGKSIGKSHFETYEGKIYFHNQEGKGYFELILVDAATFKPFSYQNEYGTHMGSDKDHVFYGHTILQGIDPKQAIYLGKNYIRDNQHVFFKTDQLLDADSATFRALEHITNTIVSFSYGKDVKRVYYENKPLPLADPMSITTFPEIYNHVKDDKHVYFKERLLEGLDAHKTTVIKVDHGLYYATDGVTHYVNGISFPKEVDNEIFGKTKAHNVKLLQLKHSGSAHMLFYDQNSIYYFDESSQSFKTAKTFPQVLALSKIDDRLLSDGQFIYFTQRKKLVSKGRSGYHYDGDATFINRLDNVTVEDFKKVKHFHNTPVYSDGKNDYISMQGYGNHVEVRNSLYLLKNMNFLNEHQIKKSDIQDIEQKTQILEIRTPKRTNYDAE